MQDPKRKRTEDYALEYIQSLIKPMTKQDSPDHPKGLSMLDNYAAKQFVYNPPWKYAPLTWTLYKPTIYFDLETKKMPTLAELQKQIRDLDTVRIDELNSFIAQEKHISAQRASTGANYSAKRDSILKQIEDLSRPPAIGKRVRLDGRKEGTVIAKPLIPHCGGDIYVAFDDFTWDGFGWPTTRITVLP